ncbi:Sodium/nucleoside cotransporter 2 [Smittium mucronatum]|uniref:Sodium/nucleoside cotransporter 2 n=1 Tax=Smittium mucronatum TaxID=133383 RepID=A0A1R0GLL3_9FUNG|nr:Sodium/nucleoside cotransporter 2 [Smittium mucronatum]
MSEEKSTVVPYSDDLPPQGLDTISETGRYSLSFWPAYLWREYFPVFIGVFWVLMTVYFGFALGLKKKTALSDILPLIFLYVFISLKFLFIFVSSDFLSTGFSFFWNIVFVKPSHMIPERFRVIVYAVTVFAIFLVVTLTLPVSEYGGRGTRIQSLAGIVIVIFFMTLTSKYPRKIQWYTVITGQLLQFILGVIVLKTNAGLQFFKWLSEIASGLLEFSVAGTEFLFGEKLIEDYGGFAFTVFPAVIFFVALIQIVYFLGGMQWLIGKLSVFFTALMGTSGSESVVASACPFVGQGESAVLVSQYVEFMTKSELHAIMTSGFSTISGSVLSGYLSLGIDLTYIITSCIMSIPCSLAMSKLRYPETEESLTKGKAVKPKAETEDINFLHAAGNGAALGMTLSLLIAASLIAIISLLAFINFILTWLGQFVGINDPVLTLNLILGYILYPFAWLLGVPALDLLSVSKLLGTKIVANEFVAYSDLVTKDAKGNSVISSIEPRSRIIVQFALCGFANFSSVGMQIGAIGAISPPRKGDLARLALSAMFTGFISTCISAAIAGLLL